jgi:hypothetical protein
VTVSYILTFLTFTSIKKVQLAALYFIEIGSILIYNVFLLPEMSERRNNTIKIKNNTLAIPAAPAAIPPKPKIAAIMAMIKKVIVQRNIKNVFWFLNVFSTVTYLNNHTIFIISANFSTTTFHIYRLSIRNEIFLIRCITLLIPVDNHSMKAPGRFLKNALECMTQCVLLPGVELHFEEVILYYSKNLKVILGRRKRK